MTSGWGPSSTAFRLGVKSVAMCSERGLDQNFPYSCLNVVIIISMLCFKVLNVTVIMLVMRTHSDGLGTMSIEQRGKKEHGNKNTSTVYSNLYCNPTPLCGVQITRKTSTNFSPCLYSTRQGPCSLLCRGSFGSSHNLFSPTLSWAEKIA